MNKLLKYTGIGITAAVVLIACKKNNLVVDKEVIAPAFAKFNTLKDADTVGTYYIRSTGETYKLPIGVTNKASTDRTVLLTYASSSAVQGTQFSAPASVVIKAGETIDSLTVSGLFAGYPDAAKKDTLLISIAGGDIPASGYKGRFRLIMRKYCDVMASDFYGDYSKSWDNGIGTGYGPYFTAITDASFVSTGPTSGTIDVENLWDYGAPTTVNVALDWADPANFKITIPDQVFVADDDVWIKGTTTGSFSSCDQTFTFRYTLYFKSTGANYYANQVTAIAR